MYYSIDRTEHHDSSKASLQEIWSKDHLTFDNFQIFKQEKVDKLAEKFPQKYCEVQEDSSEDEVEITDEVVKKGRGSKSKKKGNKKKLTPAAKKPSPPVKSPVIRGKEPSEWASILFFDTVRGTSRLLGNAMSAMSTSRRDGAAAASQMSAAQ